MSEIKKDNVINKFTIKKGFENMQLWRIYELLRNTHWACDRKQETIEKAFSNSLCFGVFDGHGRQVGCARCVTDYATMFYVSDLVISKECQDIGLGKMLVEAILSAPELKNLWGFLGTTKAKDFYGKLGFIENRDFFMSLPKTGVDGIFHVPSNN